MQTGQQTSAAAKLLMGARNQVANNRRIPEANGFAPEFQFKRLKLGDRNFEGAS